LAIADFRSDAFRIPGGLRVGRCAGTLGAPLNRKSEI
jgi:hypothetical protein